MALIVQFDLFVKQESLDVIGGFCEDLGDLRFLGEVGTSAVQGNILRGFWYVSAVALCEFLRVDWYVATVAMVVCQYSSYM